MNVVKIPVITKIANTISENRFERNVAICESIINSDHWIATTLDILGVALYDFHNGYNLENKVLHVSKNKNDDYYVITTMNKKSKNIECFEGKDIEFYMYDHNPSKLGINYIPRSTDEYDRGA